MLFKIQEHALIGSVNHLNERVWKDLMIGLHEIVTNAFNNMVHVSLFVFFSSRIYFEFLFILMYFSGSLLVCPYVSLTM